MKRLLTVLTSVIMMVLAQAQAPNLINYQGIARNPGGNVFPNQSMTLRLRIHDITAAGPVVYSETRNVTTNNFGLFTVAIGSPGASSMTGSIGTVNWASGAKYLQVEMDPNGGSSFINMGTTQLLSVPYALYATGAAPVGPAGGDLSGTYPNPTVAGIRGVNVNAVAPGLNNVLGFNGSSWTPVSLATHPDNYWRLNGSHIYNANPGNVGIGTSTPAQALDVKGNLQTLGFIMPTGAAAGKFLMSDASGFGSWSSTIAATSIVLPYRDSASSETEHIFHIIQTSPTSATGALYGVSRSSGDQAFGAGGLVSSSAAGSFSAGLRGENLSTTSNGIGVYGSQNGSGWGVYGNAPSGTGVRGTSGTSYGVYGSSNSSSGVFGFSTIGNAFGGGVFGYNPGYGGNGTIGYATRTLGYGAVGVSDSSVGVFGRSNAASYASNSNDGVAVYGEATRGGAGVFGISAQGVAGKFSINATGNNSNVLESITAGAGRSGFFQSTNPANLSTTLEVINNSNSRAIHAESMLAGPVNAGVIDALSQVTGGNAFYARATRPTGWGVASISDSSVAVGGIGYRAGSVGIFGQGWQGTAGQFIIDNTLPNSSNALEVSNAQTGNGIVVNLNNNASGLNVFQAGSGRGVLSNSQNGIAGRFENSNASNGNTTLEVNSIGTGRAITGRSNIGGFVNAGVIDGFTNIYAANAVYGRATRDFGWGVYGLSDSSAGVAGIGYRNVSVGVYGQGWLGKAGQFLIDNTFAGNNSNVVEISTTQGGNGLNVDVANNARGLQVQQGGNGQALYANSANGVAGKFETFNPSNLNNLVEATSIGAGRAIVASTNFQGYVNSGVIHSYTPIVGGNAVFGYGNRFGGWGIYGLSDSAAGVAGIGYRPGAVGIYGQGWQGRAAQFFIDNSLVNASNVVEVSNTQGGNGVVVNVSNAADAVQAVQAGAGNAYYGMSATGSAAYMENTNAASNADVIFSTTNGVSGRAFSGFITNPASVRASVRGETNGTGYGVAGLGTNDNTTSSGVYGLHTGRLGNGVIGWGTREITYGVIGHADTSIGVYGESGLGNAAYFLSYGPGTTVPALYSQMNGLSNAASFYVGNNGNTADAVVINRVGAGNSLYVDGAAFNNPTNFYNPIPLGKSAARIEGRSGLALLGHASGSFPNTGGSNVGVGVYGVSDAVSSDFNYGVVGYAHGSPVTNASVIGLTDDNAAGSSFNVGIAGVDNSTTGNHLAGYFQGDVQVTGTLSKGGGSFKIDHPQDPENKYLVHSFVESPDMMNVYNGNIVTDASGKATVDLPQYFEAENIDFKYQLTVIGQFAQAIIGEEISNNRFVILTDKPNVKVSWQVTGVRNDKWAQKNRIVPEVDKKGAEKGKLLYPELYGLPRTAGITPLFTNATQQTVSQETPVNKDQEKVNAEVVQKRAALKPAELPVATNVEAKKQERKPVAIATEKSAKLIATVDDKVQVKPSEKNAQEVQDQSVKSARLSTQTEVLPATPLKPEEQIAPAATEKTKQMNARADEVKPVQQETKDSKTVPSDKKKLDKADKIIPVEQGAKPDHG